ncbi:MAG: hypothetical protein IJX91_04205 [Clostridia bacterium]|nr:hypothetical protein [Clostridia bacterium]
MRRLHQKNTVRYYILLVVIFVFLFVSGDFGMIDVQKTAIIMAVGLDREDDTFIVTSQIAVPQSSKQGKSTETVQLVSRGKTVADAFKEINAKTGWYPKLVFCQLIVVGEKTAEKNVFDALEFFLLDEYMSDNCLVAACEGLAKDMLNVTALVDPSGSVAMQKVLSPHAERVGTVLPSTLREFAIGYYGESKSGYLPVLKTQPQQEEISGEQGGAGASSGGNSSSGDSSSGGPSSSGNGGAGDSSGGSSGGDKKQDKPVFSASETALFLNGKRVGTLTKEETFAFNAIKGKLRLASYSVEQDDGAYTLTVKRNDPKTKFSLHENGRTSCKIELTVSAGLLDLSSARSGKETADVGDVPDGVFENAEKRLSAQIKTAFDKCRTANCDLFGVLEYLQKNESNRFEELRFTALENTTAEVTVRFRNVR